MRSRLVYLVASLFVALLLGGCDSGETTSVASTPDEATEAPVIGGGPGEVAGDGTTNPSETPDPEEGEPEEVAPAEAPYPEGPYGKSNFDTIADLAFFDPYTAQWRTFGELHNNPEVKMVIVSSSAGWCPACKTEAEHLVDYYKEYKVDGLEVYFTLYEDNDGLPMVVDNEVTVAAMGVMETWKANYGINYPFLIDVQESLRAYQIDGGVPLTMVITTDDMMIRYIDEGYSSAFIENKILHYLYNN
jgi:thiol-disulfide isomerase/thioredoxin